MTASRALFRLRGERRCAGEDGVSLILAMAFLSLLGVLVVSLLTFTYGNFKTTQSVRGNINGLYGADGGADIALQLLRSNASYCPDSAAGTQTLPNQTVGGRTVAISCTTLSGSTGGGGGGGGVVWPTTYPFVLTGYNGKTGTSTFKTSGSTGNDITATFKGPAFNAGGFSFSGGSDKFHILGDLTQHGAYCNNPPSNPDKPKVTGTWSCPTSGSFPVPDPNPTLTVPTVAAVAPVTQGSCKIFFPGKYTAAPAFSNTKHYLASGVYYFEGSGKIEFEGEVFGGEPGSTDTKKFTGNTPCSTDAAAKVLAPSAPINGYGVQLAFGGNSFFQPRSASTTQVELYARVPGTPANEGTPYISMFAPKTAGTNYQASGGDAFESGGSAYRLVVHGLVYMPNSSPKIWGINNSSAGGAAPFMGGLILAGMELAINATMVSGSFADLPVASPPPATDRIVVVTATATTSSGGDIAQTVQAVVLYPANGSAPTIQSWRKT